MLAHGRAVDLYDELNKLRGTAVPLAPLQAFIEAYGADRLHGEIVAQIIEQRGGTRTWSSVAPASPPQQTSPTSPLQDQLNVLDRFLIGNFGLLLEDLTPVQLASLVGSGPELTDQQTVTAAVTNPEQFTNVWMALTESFEVSTEVALWDGGSEDTVVVPTGSKLISIVVRPDGRVAAATDKAGAAPQAEVYCTADTPSKSDFDTAAVFEGGSFVFATPAKRIRDELYGSERKFPVRRDAREKHYSSRATTTSSEDTGIQVVLEEPGVLTDPSGYRRQFLIERAAQIQAAHEYQNMQEQMSRLGMLVDMSDCKRIWVKWVEDMTRKIKKIRTDEGSNSALRKLLPEYFSSDLLAVIACRTVFAQLYSPKRKDDLQNIVSIGQYGSTKKIANTTAPRGGKMAHVTSSHKLQESPDTLAVPYTDLCVAVGDAVNFEHNCSEVDKKHAEMQQNQEKFDETDAGPKTRKEYLAKMELLQNPVWDKIKVRIRIGAELVDQLLVSCPVECDYEDAKHLLSEEQQEEWMTRNDGTTAGVQQPGGPAFAAGAAPSEAHPMLPSGPGGASMALKTNGQEEDPAVS